MSLQSRYIRSNTATRSIIHLLLQAQARSHRRGYHDESFGYRHRAEAEFPEYTPSQLENRRVNAPLLRYVDAMRTHGHRAARIDPLDLLQREEVAALDPARYGLKDESRTYPIDGIIWSNPSGPNTTSTEQWSLKQIVAHLRSIYVGRIAFEFMHSPSKSERLWFSHALESAPSVPPTTTDSIRKKRRIWDLLVKSELLDQFLQLKFPNLKRYGLEGGESMLPALNTLFRVSAEAGIEHVILGMPHRGRLNLLTGLLNFNLAELFHKIKGGNELPYGYSGDVLSHLATTASLEYTTAEFHVSLLPNPSHLEAINPVALGKTRAKQFSLIKDAAPDCKLGDKVMCVLVHGDASFTGQGVVMESLGLSNLPHFTSGGSVHLVVNNNIGYTTPAASARSSLYCSDIGKMINAPVLHVNGDYPEDVARAMEIAFEYRNTFRKDIVVDLLVYRRWGHNELDEPAFTQPLMYNLIRSRASVPSTYEEKLLQEGIITPDVVTEQRALHRRNLDEHLSISLSPREVPAEKTWFSMANPTSSSVDRDPATGVEADDAREVGMKSVEVPKSFDLHRTLRRHVSARLKSVESGHGISWATAEAMAFGTLMKEGYNVRISGQDVGRGTFSQRHAMLVDQKTESVIVPLNANIPSGGRLELANSSLSEVAVLGFEYGMSWEDPSLLPIWEAQFGDFFNGAQVIFDTFIASAETKWAKQSGLVVLLPHGLDGAGPEHSSMRLERMLQLTNDPYEFPESPKLDGNVVINMHVTYPTTPAQYFHLLRRQMKRNYRRPLIVAGPKVLLRSSAAASTLSDFEPGTRFAPVLDDPSFSPAKAPIAAEDAAAAAASSSAKDPEKVDRVILLTGKLYYDLEKERAARKLDERVALVRVEELAPFPFRALERVLRRYLWRDVEVIWVQEEPRNQGAWAHVKDRIPLVVERVSASEGKSPPALRYVGRREAAVPAPGTGDVYKEEQADVLRRAFEDL